MVVLLDLDEDVSDPYVHSMHGTGFPPPRLHVNKLMTAKRLASEAPVTVKERPNPNLNGFSAALGCYPIVSQIVHSLDLNTLYALSRTCRQFRANLLQFRKHLVTQSLRCENEQPPSTKEPGSPELELDGTGHLVSDGGGALGRLTRSKFGACARDMNCITKAPSSSSLPNRHRRLCSTCISAPLSSHTVHFSSSSSNAAPSAPVFTAAAFTRSPCSCPEVIWLCKACGHALRNEDTTYKRVWTWRTRYSVCLGGLGTGIGEGNEGVECGRREHCLAARDIEVEIDCGAGDLARSLSSSPATPPRDRPSSRDFTGSEEETGTDLSWAGEKAGYLRQEIEGIGGVVKKKVKKRVRVGKTVREYEDEREKAEYLEREVKGYNRSWCGWCLRVIPGNFNEEGLDEVLRSME
ncbi:MAG: hypothetical protein FRX48_02036 [Lasallia pustulata]|uniref:F-box domain-containing protein n=1 Tax=Lasallia pustulata TaxID=136370 RepID=A0A5M8PVJ6_9LECA|nr:MAG: hypothetical protein FRX48_02036 [Lasallia pustulata]